jgi:hypothetical protein
MMWVLDIFCERENPYAMHLSTKNQINPDRGF